MRKYVPAVVSKMSREVTWCSFPAVSRTVEFIGSRVDLTKSAYTPMRAGVSMSRSSVAADPDAVTRDASMRTTSLPAVTVLDLTVDSSS